MKVKAEGFEKFVTKLVEAATDAKEGLYICFINKFGILMVRKSSKVSFNLNGKGIPRADLHQRLLDFSKENPGEVLAKFKAATENADYHGIYNDPVKVDSASEDDEDETPQPEEKKKKKKDKKKSDSKPAGIGKKDLDKVFEEKQVKKMLKSSGVFDKKQAKKIIKSISFEDGECKGYDILDGIDVVLGRQATPEEVDSIFV